MELLVFLLINVSYQKYTVGKTVSRNIILSEITCEYQVSSHLYSIDTFFIVLFILRIQNTVNSMTKNFLATNKSWFIVLND